MLDTIVRLNIQLTKKCNQRCKSCNSYEMDCSNELSLSEFKRAIREAVGLFPIKNIAFTGGEPTLYPGLLEIASYARQFSDNVSITTNGYYCTSKDKVRELIDAGINRFSFSYHGIGTHDEFTRIKGSEERLRQAIDWLMEEKEIHKNLYVKIGTLFTGENWGRVEKVLSYAESKGMALYIEVLDDRMPIFALSPMSSDKKQVREGRLEEALLKFRSWKEQGRNVLIDADGIEFIRRWFLDIPVLDGCPLWKTDLYIESNGNIRTGCWSLGEIGNIRRCTLKEMTGSRLCSKNIEDMDHRRCGGCTCGYLMQTKGIGEGHSHNQDKEKNSNE